MCSAPNRPHDAAGGLPKFTQADPSKMGAMLCGKCWRLFTALAIGLESSPSMAFDPDAVERLKSKKVCADCELSAASLHDAYLPGVVLTNADLTGADFEGANLNFSNLSGAKLSGVNLSGVALQNVNMAGDDLSNANLSSTDLHGANLSGANLTGADLSSARLDYLKLSGANLQGTNLTGALGVAADLLVGTRLCNTTMPDHHVDNGGC